MIYQYSYRKIMIVVLDVIVIEAKSRISQASDNSQLQTSCLLNRQTELIIISRHISFFTISQEFFYYMSDFIGADTALICSLKQIRGNEISFFLQQTSVCFRQYTKNLTKFSYIIRELSTFFKVMLMPRVVCELINNAWSLRAINQRIHADIIYQ